MSTRLPCVSGLVILWPARLVGLAVCGDGGGQWFGRRSPGGSKPGSVNVSLDLPAPREQGKGSGLQRRSA